ncbi:MAG: lytic transglycosylase [Rhodobacteraceae bacterium]|nr:lytic transglycosylase [Paracoccaceae bacterium]
MSRWVIVAAALLLAACGGGNFSAPRNLDDACGLARERPHYMRAMRATERRWGVPVPVQMATFYQESKFVGDARTPFRYSLGVIPMGRQSSAFGYSQAIDSTWEWYQRDTGRRSARRDRFADAADFMGWYKNETLKRNSVPLNDSRNQYLAYHEGQTGFARRSYTAKPWLIRIADQVAARAAMYEAQLATCPRV